MANPTTPGAYSATKVIYAAGGLDYPRPRLDQFTAFETPTAGYQTRRVNISSFADIPLDTPWPFTNIDVPINGFAWLTSNTAASPLVIIAHGNHIPEENSSPGYEYLGTHLASHGIIGASIDVNFLNGSNFGENDGRAIVHLEHIRQFLNWNSDPTHPLFGRIDPSRIIIVGHSRGGEAVGHASLFNRLTVVQPDSSTPPVRLDGSAGLGPYAFQICGVVGIAPTDGQYVPLSGPTKVRDNYYVFHGSRDGDVYNFPGYRTYDRSHFIDLANPTDPAEAYKSLLWIHKANHNFFNSVWQPEWSVPTLARSQQEQVATAVITALARAEFFGDADCLRFIQNHREGERAGWLPAGVTFVSQHAARDRILIQHSEEPGPNLIVSAPVSGTINASEVTAAKVHFQLGPDSHLFQETTGARLDWQASDCRYVVLIDPKSIAIDAFSWIAFRVGQSFENNNTSAVDQDFSIVFQDHAASVALRVSSFQRLPYPDRFSQSFAEPKTVMQSIRIALSELRQAGLQTRNLRKITIDFDRTPSGTLYLDDLQVCN